MTGAEGSIDSSSSYSLREGEFLEELFEIGWFFETSSVVCFVLSVESAEFDSVSPTNFSSNEEVYFSRMGDAVAF